MHKSRLIGGVRTALVVVGAVFGVTLLTAGEATADDAFQLKSRLGNFCLDAPDGNLYTPTVINPCDGSQSQRWHSAAGWQIENVAFPDACLGNAPFSQLVSVEPCYLRRQLWSIQPDGQVRSIYGNPCLSVDGSVANPGTQVSIALCSADNPAEEWDSVP